MRNAKHHIVPTFFFILSEDWNDAKAAAAEYAAEPEVPGVGVDPCGVYTSSGDWRD